MKHNSRALVEQLCEGASRENVPSQALNLGGGRVRKLVG